MSIDTVQEVQGLYGPFSISEKVIQKIWLQGDYYQQDLRTASGKRLKVLDPGFWNMNEGPDFKEARLEIDGAEVCGDVEIHFRASDWFNHGHDTNPNFNKVVLHVVLYAPAKDDVASGLPIESLVLLPLLERDLEDYAMEAALIDLEQVNELEWFERFMKKSLPQRRSLIEELAEERWMQKVAFAARRLEEADWMLCCHQSLLEVLGYARNRSAMHKVAARYSIADFASGIDTDQIFEAFRNDWKLSGCRPANHPKLRLEQYAQICRARQAWPDMLLQTMAPVESVDAAEPGAFRKAAQAKELHRRISEEIFQGVIGEKRLNTLFCDAVFPLAQAANVGESWASHWQHWYPGDFPESFARFYRQAGFSAARIPMTNGMMQGILLLFAGKGEALDS
jgi:hypothetical protein